PPGVPGGDDHDRPVPEVERVRAVADETHRPHGQDAIRSEYARPAEPTDDHEHGTDRRQEGGVAGEGRSAREADRRGEDRGDPGPPSDGTERGRGAEPKGEECEQRAKAE